MKVFNVDDVAAKWSHTEKLASLILWRRHSEIFELIKPVHGYACMSSITLLL